jgi:adenylate cyclase
LDAYYAQRWDDALAIFQRLKESHPHDQPVAMMIERCQSFKITPPEPGWNGVTHMDHK